MSCGARLPVYVLFGGAFFGAQAGNLTFGMYVFGIAIAFIIGFVMRRTIYRDKPHHPLILELPPYRVPNLRNVGFQTWRRTHGFIHKATTIILGASVLLWLMLAIPISEGKFGDVSPSNSLLGAASGAVAPVFAPAGFGTWQAGSALVTGFIAKETIVSTMSQVYTDTVTDEEATNTEEVFTLAQDITMIAAGFGEAVVLTLQETANIVPRTLNLLPGINVPEADWLNTNEENTDTTRLETALRDAFSPLAAIAFNLFVLLYVPCAAAVAAMRQEFGMRWALAQAAFTFILAWSVAVVVYQGGTLLGLGV
jgi:ferrous iron transport protein B